MKLTLEQEELHFFVVVDVLEEVLLELVMFEVHVIIDKLSDKFDRELLPYEAFSIKVTRPGCILGASIPHPHEISTRSLWQHRPPRFNFDASRHIERLEQCVRHHLHADLLFASMKQTATR